MTEFNQRERYLLARALESQMRKLKNSEDFPEETMYIKFIRKVTNWVYEIKGNITSDEGVGE